MPTRLPSSRPRSLRLTLALLAAFLLERSTAAAPQVGPAPVIREHVQDQMPVLNGVPSCDDGDTAIDGSQGSCGAVNTPTIELGDYEDTGDPVALHNGMVSYRAVDLHIPGRGLDFTLTRRYSSKLVGNDGPLGYGWTHGYDVWIQIQGGQVILWNGNQRADVWEGDKTAGFTAPRGVFSTLTWNGATNTYTHRSRFGLKSVFQEVTVSGNTTPPSSLRVRGSAGRPRVFQRPSSGLIRKSAADVRRFGALRKARGLQAT